MEVHVVTSITFRRNGTMLSVGHGVFDDHHQARRRLRESHWTLRVGVQHGTGSGDLSEIAEGIERRTEGERERWRDGGRSNQRDCGSNKWTSWLMRL